MRLRTSSVLKLEHALCNQEVIFETHQGKRIDVSGGRGKMDVKKFLGFIKPEMASQVEAMDYGPISLENNEHLGIEIRKYFHGNFNVHESHADKLVFVGRLRDTALSQRDQIPDDQRANYEATLEVMNNLVGQAIES